MIYLASPYSGTEEEQEQRYLAAMACTAALLSKGLMVYSPIVHCHPIALRYNLPKDAEFWKAYNYNTITRCDALYFLQIEGWDKSKGVKMERGWADELKKQKKRVIPEGHTYLITDWR